MAFTNFYVNSNGSNLNAGSTAADAGGSDAASLTYAGGTYVRATGVFTVASGNPLSDGVTVGHWISIYTTAAATTTRFVGQCTARSSTTITVSTTVVMGVATNVSETAAATTAKVGGAWHDEIVLAATGFATFTVPASTKIHLKGNLSVAASRSISMTGSATAALWFSGYATTPGDLDADTTNSLTKPTWTMAAGTIFNTTGTFQHWSGLSLVGNVSANLWNCNNLSLSRVRVENISSNAAAYALTAQTSGMVLSYCWFKAPATGTSSGVVVVANTRQCFIGCVSEGGGKVTFDLANQDPVMQGCISLNATGHGFLDTTGPAKLLNCTVYNATGDGMRWSGTPLPGATVVGCLFSNCGGYGINNASGANVVSVIRASNDFYACTSNPENGFGDHPALFQQTDGSAVVTSSTDMTPVSGSNARAKGFPGKFENQTYTSYADIGAVRHIDPSGGSASASVFLG